MIYDIADNDLVAAGLVVPALNLTDQPKIIVIDGVRPEKPTSISEQAAKYYAFAFEYLATLTFS